MSRTVRLARRTTLPGFSWFLRIACNKEQAQTDAGTLGYEITYHFKLDLQQILESLRFNVEIDANATNFKTELASRLTTAAWFTRCLRS